MLNEGTQLYQIAEFCRTILKTKKFITPTDISNGLKIQKNSASSAISNLVKQNYLKRLDTSKYISTQLLINEFPSEENISLVNENNSYEKTEINEMKELIVTLEKLINKLINVTDYIAKEKNIKKLINELNKE